MSVGLAVRLAREHIRVAHQHDASPSPSAGSTVLLFIVAGGAVAGATQTDETGPVLAFVGALLVVIITAITTNRRQVRQLAAEAERHGASLKSEKVRQAELLASERARLEQRLNHERRLSDIQHLRGMLDEAAAAYEDAAAACWSLAITVSLGLDENTIRRRSEEYDQTNMRATGVATELHRLEMRFKPDHPVFVEYATVNKLIQQRWRLLRDAVVADEVLSEGSEGDRMDMSLEHKAAQAFSRFAASVRDAAGVREMGT